MFTWRDQPARTCDVADEPQTTFVEHLLSIPKRPPTIADDEELFPRERFAEREFELEE